MANSVSAQIEKRTKPKGNEKTETILVPSKAEPEKVVVEEERETTKDSLKRNSRPESGETVKENTEKKNARNPVVKENEPTYFYEFTQPAFVISHVVIEHDENGKGKITFRKKDLDEEFTDPIQISSKSLEKLKALWNALNFLDSAEEYQAKDKDFSHLGTMNLKMRRGERERTAEFNWTENKDAKALADEYRKIGNQSIWMFDIAVARENQPLETPRIMKTLDLYLRRNEISDPKQIIPFLQELSNDERLPLIARNHATRLIKEIEKQKS